MINNKKDFLFTSESVTEGHPDKICDQISDAVLDEILKKDRNARVALETMVKLNRITISGEVTTDSKVDIPEIVKNNQTGYLCNNGDVDMWSQKIRFMLDNPDVAKRFGKNARKFVKKKFSWKKIAENFLDIIASYNNGLN